MRRFVPLLALCACIDFDRAYDARAAMLGDAGTAGGSAGGATAGGNAGSSAGGSTAGGSAAGGVSGGMSGGMSGGAAGGMAGGTAGGAVVDAGCQQAFCLLDRVAVPSGFANDTVDCQTPVFTDLAHLTVYCWRDRQATVTVYDGGLLVTDNTFYPSQPVADGRHDEHWLYDSMNFYRVLGAPQVPSLPKTCDGSPFTIVSMHSPAPSDLWAGGTPNGAVCHYLPDGGSERYTVPGVPGGISAIFASDAGVWVGNFDNQIRLLDGTLELTVTGGGGITSLHGLEPGELFATSHNEGIWRRVGASWVQDYPGNSNAFYLYEVRVLGPGDVWAWGTENSLVRSTDAGWQLVSPQGHLGLPAGRYYFEGVRGNAQELLLTGALRNTATPAWDGFVIRMLRGP